ncbi:Nudix hydrolase 1 [Colletotrichum sojae]|uniref:Nudix hydrolase 1 n=1 Tax=Colletotrichum sojae TaxID=2175907 RepID=A0A8H6J7P0_9PEZI|nr:Nudix hydrolase 1 [Colletotrichum sojae]
MSCNPFDFPRVGVAAIIQRKDGRVVVGKRQSSHGAGTWQLPGGHLEFGESFFECAARETLEETGLTVIPLNVAGVTNDVYGELGKHYITIFVECRMEDESAEPKNLEPTKCDGWHWNTWQDIRDIDAASSTEGSEKLFLPLANLVRENPELEKTL